MTQITKTASASSKAPSLTEVKTVGLGWHLFKLRATNAAMVVILRLLGNGLGVWDGSILPPKPSARAIIEKSLTASAQKAGQPFRFSLPVSNAVDPKLPPAGSNYRQRKWWDEKTQTLCFWVKVERA